MSCKDLKDKIRCTLEYTRPCDKEDTKQFRICLDSFSTNDETNISDSDILMNRSQL